MVFSLWQNFKLKFYTICTFQTVRPEECRWRNLKSEMGKKDLTDMLGGGWGWTRQKYRCKADGCQVTPMGVNLAKQVCRYEIIGMQIWTFSKHHIFKYDFWEKTQYSNMNFWCYLVTPVKNWSFTSNQCIHFSISLDWRSHLAKNTVYPL